MNDNHLAVKENNFDLVRLLAALQVVFSHACYYLGLGNKFFFHELWQIIGLFPGVPIFFITSGFLISASFERNSHLTSFYINRCLRIYPALWVAFFFSLCILIAVNYWSTTKFTFVSFVLWMLSQITILQFYNPPFLKSFGVGTLNGSLWTIPVELQFYVLIPFLYLGIKHLSWKQSNCLLCVLIILFFCINLFCHHYPITRDGTTLIVKLMNVTFLPHFYMFLLGVFFQRNSSAIIPWCENKFTYYVIVYIVLCNSLKGSIQIGSNSPHVILVLGLCFVIFSFAFSFKFLSYSLTRENDISYGIYIYHMLIINLFVHYHFIHHSIHLILIYVFTILLAILSWYFIEKPALMLKKKSLRRLLIPVSLKKSFS